MDYQQRFVVGVSRRRRPVEGSRDHFFVVNHGELVVELVAAGEAWGSHALEAFIKGLIVFFKFAVASR